jgi:hypothetical protein
VTLAPLGVRTPLGVFVFCRYQVAVRGYCTRLMLTIVTPVCMYRAGASPGAQPWRFCWSAVQLVIFVGS